MPGKKYTHEMVALAFARSGCQLKTKYVDRYTKLEWVCACGKPQTSALGIKRRSVNDPTIPIRCRSCQIKKSLKAPTYDDFVALLEPEGWEMVSESSEYRNTKTLLRVLNPLGTESKTSYNRFKAGHRSKEEAVNTQRHTHEYVSQRFEERGLKLLDRYHNKSTLMRYRCRCGDIHEISFENLRRKIYGCSLCRLADKLAGIPRQGVMRYLKDYSHISLKNKLPDVVESDTVVRYNCTVCGKAQRKKWTEIVLAGENICKKGCVILTSDEPSPARDVPEPKLEIHPEAPIDKFFPAPGTQKTVYVNKNGATAYPTGNTLRQWKNRSGYLYVNANSKHYSVHRLITKTFLDNPSNAPCVNHKNGVKSDNRLKNLEWCSYRYNTIHAVSKKLINYHTVEVGKYTLDLTLVAKYESVTQASTLCECGLSGIQKTCQVNMKRVRSSEAGSEVVYKSYRGWVWLYAKERIERYKPFTELDPEDWKPSSYPRLLVSKEGQIYDSRSETILLQIAPDEVDPFVSVRVGQKRLKLPVHREVAKAWVKNPKKVVRVKRLDGDRFNNSYKNLVWF